MQYINCDIDTCIHRNHNRNVIFFGAGQNLRFAENSRLSALKECVPYIIDNGNSASVSMWGRVVPVYHPQKLLEESNCSVIITTAKYMVDMYAQLESLGLSDETEVYIFPFMLLEQKHPLTETQRQEIFAGSGDVIIPKIIHCFWFSGSEKPLEYQRCIDTWREFCPDYEIHEWNLDNYDGSAHPFFKKAIEVKAWAYATDYARLDVVSRYGGIYMDMDVELIRSLDPLLSHDGAFPFCSDNVIELAMFMAKKAHPLIEELRSLYENVQTPDTKEGFNSFYQPYFVMDKLVEYGVSMDGTYQNIDENVFLPRQICMPLDYCLYELHTDQDTIAIHRANAGWHEADCTKIRITANRQLKARLES